MLRVPSLSRRNLDELRKMLANYGMAFADEVPGPDPLPQLAASLGVSEGQIRRLRGLFRRHEDLERRHVNLTGQLKRCEEDLRQINRAGADLMAEMGCGAVSVRPESS